MIIKREESLTNIPWPYHCYESGRRLLSRYRHEMHCTVATLRYFGAAVTFLLRRSDSTWGDDDSTGVTGAVTMYSLDSIVHAMAYQSSTRKKPSTVYVQFQ